MKKTNVSQLSGEVFQAYDGDGLMRMSYAFSEHDDTPISKWDYFAIAEVPVGATVGYHRHVNTDEWFYVLAGNAQLCVDGETCTIQRGDIILTESGSSHGISHVREALTFVVVQVSRKNQPL